MMLEFLVQRDHRLMVRVNGWRPPRWFRVWMLCATRGGDGWLWSTLGLCLLLFGGADAVQPVAAAGVAAAVGIVCFLVLKQIFRRKRPCAIAKHCWADLLPPDQFSFPSGHSITAFSVAVSLGCAFPGLLAGVLFCAASVAASRIMLGMHFLSDVVAGSAIGAILGYAAFVLII
jgi:undecaprenyl-diphosphatase